MDGSVTTNWGDSRGSDVMILSPVSDSLAILFFIAIIVSNRRKARGTSTHRAYY